MIKYHWQQRYALDRFDLEGPMGRLVGWIVGTPDQSTVDQRVVGYLGYISNYLVKSEGGKKITWSWKIWWAERDEKGLYKPDSSTDGVTYFKMDDAKISCASCTRKSTVAANTLSPRRPVRMLVPDSPPNSAGIAPSRRS